MSVSEPKISITTGSLSTQTSDAVILPLFQDEPEKGKKTAAATPELDRLSAALNNVITVTMEEEKFDASASKTLIFRKGHQDSLNARRLILTGLGNQTKLRPEKIEKAVLAAAEAALSVKDVKRLAVFIPSKTIEKVSLFSAVQAVIDGCVQATYRSRESKDTPPALDELTLVFESDAPGAEGLAKRAIAMAKARALVKDLVNMPSNTKRTDTLVATAREIAARIPHITIDVHEGSWVEENMPSFYTVALGAVATDPPKFIRITYNPPGAVKRIAVVGKSVIFDTGGYQVKPDNFMNTMKGDMTGGAVTLGSLQAVAEMGLPVAVYGYLAAAPNKIDSHAMLPDSIINSTCGKKIEIRHTDAEGRLTLIDAVAMAARENPESIVTIATLTGSASRAVGLSIALMGNDDDLRQRIVDAARATGEPLQTLDVIEQDYEDIKSKLDGADIINTSQNKNRGAQSAAAFVMTGAPDGTKMAHLDIAGADMTSEEKATGISLKTIVQFLASVT
ncbi:MAG: leucyl aminopeptidase family protein [Spirochaetia bacterium]|nr:leucyl aminopeptidase family protein [Spirochaetia bacterium]